MTSIARAMTSFTGKEIRTLFNTAQPVVKTAILELRTAPATKEHGRILIVIPKKVGSAPERNKIKRRIKALFYEQQLYARGIDVVALVYPGACDIAFDVLGQLLAQACTKP